MKANEPMIGDWVFNKIINKPMRVYPTMLSQMFRRNIEAKTEDYGIFPITLTPEILEKNGFENDFYETESVADYVAIQIEGYSLRCKSRGCDFDSALVKWCNGRCDIVTDDDYEARGAMIYVHQLQHALRLCGIEKEIVL